MFFPQLGEPQNQRTYFLLELSITWKTQHRCDTHMNASGRQWTHVVCTHGKSKQTTTKQRPREESSLHDPCLSSMCCSRGADSSQRRRLIQMATGSCQCKNSVCVHFVQAAWQGLIATPKTGSVHADVSAISEQNATDSCCCRSHLQPLFHICPWTLFTSWSTTIGESHPGDDPQLNELIISSHGPNKAPRVAPVEWKPPPFAWQKASKEKEKTQKNRSSFPMKNISQFAAASYPQCDAQPLPTCGRYHLGPEHLVGPSCTGPGGTQVRVLQAGERPEVPEGLAMDPWKLSFLLVRFH